MTSDVRLLTHVLLPQDAESDDHGPWANPDSEREIAELLDQGYEVLSSALAPIATKWVRDLEVTSQTRLVLVTTMRRG